MICKSRVSFNNKRRLEVSVTRVKELNVTIKSVPIRYQKLSDPIHNNYGQL